MKKTVAILAAILLTVSVFAQAPQKISYQAVIRDASNNLVPYQAVGMKISILQNTTPVYTEIQTPHTNANGLVSIEIGGGEGFDAIDWANGTYFIKTETDPTGGVSYTITGTSQLLSVPYAFYAKTAGALTHPADGSETILTEGTNVTITGAGTSGDPYVVNATSASTTHYLGEEYDGGIIFYLYIGSDGVQHGLVVSKTESQASWGGSTLVSANRTDDGAYNMNLMPTGAGTAREWVEALGAGWYLPSIDELTILSRNRFHVNKALRSGGFALLSSTVAFWSSTEYNSLTAFTYHFAFFNTNVFNKIMNYSVRGVRAF